MTILSVYVDDDTMKRLEHSARQTGRTPEELAEAAVAETAMMATCHDPVFQQPRPHELSEDCWCRPTVSHGLVTHRHGALEAAGFL